MNGAPYIMKNPYPSSHQFDRSIDLVEKRSPLRKKHREDHSKDREKDHILSTSLFSGVIIIAMSVWALTGCDDNTSNPSLNDPNAGAQVGAQAGVQAGVQAGAQAGAQTGGAVQEVDMTDGGVEALEDMGLDMMLPDMEWTFDLGVEEGVYDQVPAATDRLYAGYAERSLGFPLGSAVVGFAPRQGVITPFAIAYPGTDTQHTALTARALVLRQGVETLVLVRTDAIGVWQDFIVDVQRELRQQGRGDLADGLIIGATHTHASGGRIFNHRFGNIAVGPFFAPFYTKYRQNIVEAILEADEKASPAQVGYDTIQVDFIHSDRRCENGDSIDHSMGVLKVTDDEGTLQAVVINYAMHGTIINNNQERK